MKISFMCVCVSVLLLSCCKYTNTHLPYIEINKFTRFVGHKASKIATYKAMPSKCVCVCVN